MGVKDPYVRVTDPFDESSPLTLHHESIARVGRHAREDHVGGGPVAAVQDQHRVHDGPVLLGHGHAREPDRRGSDRGAAQLLAR